MLRNMANEVTGIMGKVRPRGGKTILAQGLRAWGTSSRIFGGNSDVGRALYVLSISPSSSMDRRPTALY